MKISAKSEYACLAVLALARQRAESSPVRIREISEAYAHSGAIPGADPASVEGRGARCEHARRDGRLSAGASAAAISLSEILTAIDAPETLVRDAGGRARSTASVLASVWEDVRAAERAVLDRTTIAQLAERCSPHEWVI